jgi:RNA polymerase sigma-70 factor (ECF subfamily)
MDAVSFDEEYVRRLINGDPATEQHFVSYFGDLIWIKLRSRVRSPQLIEDVRQDTFLRVLKNLRTSGITHPERLGAYVHAVCTNVLYEHFRAESRFRELGEEGAAMIDPHAGADESFVSQELQKRVAAVLQEMPEKDRDLLTAIFLDEQDKDDVCRKYRVNRDYLRVLLYRARRRFRSASPDAFAAGH